ncbi:MAG: ABC transporter permease [Chloroflexota bacterium]|nr:ABC transporter permease [Caldilinea sp.]GIK73750.1 MAG: ABC transporter permease [Chloroflexota bacterium]
MEWIVGLQALLQATVRMAAPLTFTAVGETYGERAGVINIGLEGLMLIGAVTAYAVAFASGSIWLGVLAAGLAAMVFGVLFGVVTITLGANQIVTGAALNLVGLGLSSFIYRAFFGTVTDRAIQPLETVKTPLLSQIPVLGPVLFEQNLLVYAALLLAPLAAWVLNRTMLGLAIRSVGEHPKATATAGLSVIGLRYGAVAFGALLAGVGGAYLSVAYANQFVENMVAGRGFIALAIVVFGRWSPLGALWASLLFGFTFALQLRLQAANIQIAYQFLQILPYVATIVAMILLRGQSAQPKALGVPYTERA